MGKFTAAKDVGSFVGSVAIWRTILGCFASICVFSLILYCIYRYKKNWVVTYATLLEVDNNPSCREHINNEKYKQNRCDYKFSYVNYRGETVEGHINNHEVIPEIEKDGRRLIKIEYNPNTRNEVSTPFPRKILMILFIIIIIINILMMIFYIVFRNNNVVKGIALVNQVLTVTKKKK